LEEGRFGTHQNLQALIENWSLKIGHWQLNSAFQTTQGPFEARRAILLRIARERWRPRRQHPAAASRSQAPGNPFREVCNMSKNRRVSAAQVPYYHCFMGLQHLFSHLFFT